MATLYIQQPYELYSAENHEAWRWLFSRMAPRWDRYANGHFLAGIDSLCLDPARIPQLEDVNRIFAAADRISGKSGQRLHPCVSLLRLLAQSSVPHDDHDPPAGSPRLPSGTRHFPRYCRSRADAYRSRLC